MSKFALENKYKAIVVGGSAGSFQPIARLLSKIPSSFPLPIFLCLHRLKHVRHGFVEALSIKSKKKIIEPMDKDTIKKEYVYLAPANYHLGIELGNSISLTTDNLLNNSRPSIDIMFTTAAYAYRHKLIGILLSGANRDGAAGMAKIKELGGLTLIQDPEESMIETMPLAAQRSTTIDYVLTSDQITDFFLELHKNYQA